MHPEHEEALRTEFTGFVHLEQQAIRAQAQLGAGRGYPAADYERLLDGQHEIAERWMGGPHAQAWAELHACYVAFVEHPDQMRQLATEIDTPDGRHDPRWTAIARRDIAQARPLAETTLALCTARDHAVDRAERGR